MMCLSCPNGYPNAEFGCLKPKLPMYQYLIKRNEDLPHTGWIYYSPQLGLLRLLLDLRFEVDYFFPKDLLYFEFSLIEQIDAVTY